MKSWKLLPKVYELKVHLEIIFANNYWCSNCPDAQTNRPFTVIYNTNLYQSTYTDCCGDVGRTLSSGGTIFKRDDKVGSA